MGRASFSAAGPRLALRGGDRQRVLGKGGVCWHPGDDHGYRGRRGQYSASGRAGAGQLVAAGFGLGASSVLRDSFAMRIDCGDFGERGAFVAISAEDAGGLFAGCMDEPLSPLPDLFNTPGYFSVVGTLGGVGCYIGALVDEAKK